MTTSRETIEQSMKALVNLGNLAEDTLTELERGKTADEGRRIAEAKIVDIGKRKNALIKAIEAKGFVVRWQQDGTPEVLTTEEARQRDRKAEEDRILGESLRPYFGGIFGSYFRRTFLPFPEQQPQYIVSWELGPAEVNYTPASRPVDALVKQETVAAPQPEPTIYDRAMKRAGVQSIKHCTLGFSFCVECKPRRDLLDQALRLELSLEPGYTYARAFLSGPQSPDRLGRIWHARPWK